MVPRLGLGQPPLPQRQFPPCHFIVPDPWPPGAEPSASPALVPSSELRRGHVFLPQPHMALHQATSPSLERKQAASPFGVFSTRWATFSFPSCNTQWPPGHGTGLGTGSASFFTFTWGNFHTQVCGPPSTLHTVSRPPQSCGPVAFHQQATPLAEL